LVVIALEPVQGVALVQALSRVQAQLRVRVQLLVQVQALFPVLREALPLELSSRLWLALALVHRSDTSTRPKPPQPQRPS
jgi:hypothetical protein